MKSILLVIFAVGLLSAANAHAAIWDYAGNLTSCPQVCADSGGSVGNAVTGVVSLDMGAPDSGYVYNPATDSFIFQITVTTEFLFVDSGGPGYFAFDSTPISTDASGDFLSGIISARISELLSGQDGVVTIDLASGSLTIEADFFGNAFPILEAGGSFTPQVVPLPAAAWLFGSALLGLVAVKRKK